MEETNLSEAIKLEEFRNDKLLEARKRISEIDKRIKELNEKIIPTIDELEQIKKQESNLLERYNKAEQEENTEEIYIVSEELKTLLNQKDECAGKVLEFDSEKKKLDQEKEDVSKNIEEIKNNIQQTLTPTEEKISGIVVIGSRLNSFKDAILNIDLSKSKIIESTSKVRNIIRNDFIANLNCKEEITETVKSKINSFKNIKIVSSASNVVNEAYEKFQSRIANAKIIEANLKYIEEIRKEKEEEEKIVDENMNYVGDKIDKNATLEEPKEEIIVDEPKKEEPELNIEEVVATSKEETTEEPKEEEKKDEEVKVPENIFVADEVKPEKVEIESEPNNVVSITDRINLAKNKISVSTIDRFIKNVIPNFVDSESKDISYIVQSFNNRVQNVYSKKQKELNDKKSEIENSVNVDNNLLSDINSQMMENKNQMIDDKYKTVDKINDNVSGVEEFRNATNEMNDAINNFMNPFDINVENIKTKVA